MSGVGRGPGIESGRTRASGREVADEVGEEQAKEVTEPLDDQMLDVEREIIFQSTVMSRFPTDWTKENAVTISRVKHAVDEVLHEKFADAYQIMDDIYNDVRFAEADENGEPLLDEHGRPVWAKNELGAYLEDWTSLGLKERENYLLRLTTLLFEWEQTAADLWTEAMFSKAMWVENFAREFNAAVRGTVDDRTNRANVHAAAERYFAVYTSALSRHADALVKSMERLTLRLKDTLG